MSSESFIDSILSIIEDNTADPTLFLDVQKKASKSFRKATKLLYDFTKRKTGSKSQAPPELIIDGFDEEQIWQQIELENEHVISKSIAAVSKILSNKQLIKPNIDNVESQSKSLKKRPKNSKDESEEEDDDGEEDEEEEDKEDDGPERIKAKNKTLIKRRKKEPSIVDDKFFKMQDLDDYLNIEDRRESKNLDKEEKNSDDESVDLFNDFSDNDDDDEEAENARLVKYADFFDSPESDAEAGSEFEKFHQKDLLNSEEEVESEGETFEDSEEQARSSTKKVKFNLPVDSEESDQTSEVPEKEDSERVKSSNERRRDRKEKMIEKMEEEFMSEKGWQVKGEVRVSNRPQNSLLEDFLEHDVVSRPPPIMTEQTNLKLEDIIRQRIKDKAWDDVIRKIKPVDTPTEYKKKLVMDQEKSKLSLAEIYEQEYVKQKQAIDPDQNTEEPEPKEHNELREMLHSIFRKLDALSNYNYTPIPAKPELKIVSNVPAINMEDVAPVSTSDATMLAPEEVHAKKRGDLIGQGERTKTDKKRQLRKKKKKQREFQQAKEKKEKLKAVSEIRKKRNKETAKVVEKLTKSRNVMKMDEQDHKATKSSTAFFNQLQDEVQSQIKMKSTKKPVKKDKSRISAVKLKL